VFRRIVALGRSDGPGTLEKVHDPVAFKTIYRRKLSQKSEPKTENRAGGR